MSLSTWASQAAGRAPLGALAPRQLSERHRPSLPLAATAAPAAPPSRRGRQRRSEHRRRPLAGGTTCPLAAAVATAIAATAVAASSTSTCPDSGASASASAAVALAALPRGAFYAEYADYYTEDDEVCPFCYGQLGGCQCHAEPQEENITVGQFCEATRCCSCSARRLCGCRGRSGRRLFNGGRGRFERRPSFSVVARALPAADSLRVGRHNGGPC